MKELNREQPTLEPANVINITNENGAVSGQVGSQQDTFGKFKNAEALLEAYNNLQSEFTKKCQLLSKMQKDKINESQNKKVENFDDTKNENKNIDIVFKSTEDKFDFLNSNSIDNANNDLLEAKDENNVEEKNQNIIKNNDENQEFYNGFNINSTNFENQNLNEDKNQIFSNLQENDEEKRKFEKDFQEFLDANSEAKLFEDEIKQRFNCSSNQNQANPFEIAWARVVLDHLKDGNQKASDPIINNFVLSDEKVRNQIILDYLNSLIKHKPPYVISSQGGERVSSVIPDAPSSLAEAKEMVSKMFN